MLEIPPPSKFGGWIHPLGNIIQCVVLIHSSREQTDFTVHDTPLNLSHSQSVSQITVIIPQLLLLPLLSFTFHY